MLCSIENPGRSFIWQTRHMATFLSDVPHYKTYFHHCMFGSARRKNTCLVHNIPTLCDMAITCDNSHPHEPWGHTHSGWATAEETAYPWLLCRKIATLVALHLQAFGVQCPTPTFATRQQTDSQSSSKGLPWVSEFKAIRHIDASEPIPQDARLISTPAVGCIASASQKTIGVHRTLEEFVQAVLEAGHPGPGTCS